MSENIVAVYGTLKRGKTNHFIMELLSAEFLGEGKTAEKYPLTTDGMLPYLFDEAGVGHRIPVEIYRVSDAALAVIDRFECHPKFYARKSTKCELSSGEVLDCFVYFANGGRPTKEKSKLLKNY